MTALTGFLRARIAEDEAVAQAAINKPVEIRGAEVAAHIGRWSSRRVLAECEAKREIVDLYQAWDERHAMTGTAADKYTRGALYAAVLRLGLPYSDHSGYQQEWKP